MTDITNRNLDAALIDQIVAGSFCGRAYAFVAVPTDDNDWMLGVAVANEQGYSPLVGYARSTRRPISGPRCDW